MRKLVFFLLLISSAAFAQPDYDFVYFAEEMPSFPGPGTLEEYLAKNLKYPVAEKEAGLDGTVYVGFVVEADGSITKVEVRKGVAGAPGLMTEAVRVIAAMPKWTPGKINGKLVRVGITQPVKFKLDDRSSPALVPLCGQQVKQESLGFVHPRYPEGRVLPHYPGGDSAMQAYFRKNVMASKSYSPGNGERLWIELIVDTNGALRNISQYGLSDAPAAMNKAAASAVCAMPAWTPGTVHGKKANIRVLLEITYTPKGPVVFYAGHKNTPPPPPPPPAPVKKTQ